MRRSVRQTAAAGSILSIGRVRRRVARAAIQALEDRRLMSLTVDLRATDGTDSVTVNHVGQAVTLDVVAVVTGVNADASTDGLFEFYGSALSTAVGSSAVAGNLSAVSLTSDYTSQPSQSGTVQDLNADGNLDVGSNTDSASENYVFPRDDAGSANVGTAVNGSLSTIVGSLTYTVTSLNGGGQTNLVWRNRSDLGGNQVVALWREDGSGTNNLISTYQAGSPFHVYTAASSATTGTITTTVFKDADGNGTRTSADAAFPGGQVYVDLGGSGSYVTGDPLGTADSTGAVTITGVPAGAHTVRAISPTGYTQTAPTVGTGRTVTVTAGQTSAISAFGLEVDGSIAGTIYTDANGNGTDDAGDSPLGTATIYLDANNNGTLDAGEVSTTSFTDGSFLFSNVVPKAYVVRQVVAAGHTQSQPAGTGGNAVTVTPGLAVTGVTFGVETTPGAVTGTVFADANADGTQGSGEAGVAGVTVTATAGGTAVKTVTTGPDGTYTIAGLQPGTYTVADTLPTGDSQTAPAGGSYSVTVASGATTSGQNFGVEPTPTPSPTPTATVSGVVYTDVDASGSYTAGDTLLASQSVYVDVNADGTDDSGDFSAVTDANGAYTIADVTPGSYTVRLTTAAGATVTEPTAGSYAVTVTAGQTLSAQNFGLAVGSPLPTPPVTPTPTPTGTIDGIVYADANGDGLRDTADAGIADLTVYVDVNGNGTLDAGEPSATTTSSGIFSITTAPVAAGDLVRVVLPTGDTATNNPNGFSTTVADATTTAYTLPFGLATTPLTASPVTATIVPTKTPPSVVGGDKGTVRVKVTNPSSATTYSGPLTVLVYTTPVGVTPVTADLAGGTNAVAGTLSVRKVTLKPGKSATYTAKFVYPSTLATGSHVVTASVATTAASANLAVPSAAPVTINAPTVDLAAAFTPTTAKKVAAGKRTSVTVKVTNKGTVAATGPYTVNVYYSTAATLDNSATFLATVTRRMTVKAGKSTSFRLAITAPTLTPGSYSLFAVVGATTTPGDSDTSNNTAMVTTTA